MKIGDVASFVADYSPVNVFVKYQCVFLNEYQEGPALRLTMHALLALGCLRDLVRCRRHSFVPITTMSIYLGCSTVVGCFFSILYDRCCRPES